MKTLYWLFGILIVLWWCCKKNYCPCIGTTTNVQPDVVRYGDRNNFDTPFGMSGTGQPIIQGGSGSGSVS